MAKLEGTNGIEQLSDALHEIITNLYGECLDIDGMLRSRLTHMGVSDSGVVVDVLLEGGLREDAPYGVLHFHSTLAQDIPDEALPNVLIALNDLNHVICAGAFPGFGCFAYYEPLSQVYLSYRLPVNLNDVDTELDNIRFYLASLYDQMDLFVDYILFVINNDEDSMTIEDYMDYLDQLSDISEQENMFEALKGQYEEMLKEMGIDPDSIEDIDISSLDAEAIERMAADSIKEEE